MGIILTGINRTWTKVFKYIVAEKAREEELGVVLQDILGSITDGFFAVDQDWTIRYFNQAAERLLRPGVGVLDKSLWDVLQEDICSSLYLPFIKVMSDRIPSSFEHHYPALNLWLQVHANPAKSGMTIYLRNITESKRQTTLETLEKDVLSYYTEKGATIESTVQLMLEGIRRIHPELLCSVLQTKGHQLHYFKFSHLPSAFIDATDHISTSMYRQYLDTDLIEKAANLTNQINQHQLSACGLYPLADYRQEMIGLFTVYLQSSRVFTPAENSTLKRAKFLLTHILQDHLAMGVLRKSEEKYRDLFQLHPLALWLYDVETCRFLDVNEAAIRQYGYSRAEFLGMTIRDIRPEEDLKLLEEKLVFTKSAEAYSVGLFRHRKKNGELINVEVRSNSMDYNGVKARLILSNDITGKVEMERALNLSEKRFKAMVQEGSDLINILDFNGSYIYASPASAAMFGKLPEEIIGWKVMDFIHQDDQEMVKQSIEDLKSSRRVQTRPYRFRTQSGTYRWLQSIGTNLLDDPAINGIVVNSKDISNSVDHIHAIEEQNARLKDIAWTQSHVVRAPLSRIMGLIELLDHTSVDNELHSELLGHVHQSATELDGIIRDIVRKTELVS